MSAYVRIVLEDPDRESEQTVWVSHYPVRQNDLLGVRRAAGDAAMSFMCNLAQDEEARQSVTRWLRGGDVIGK